MWSRKELKSKSKASFTANYWICVLAGLILTIALGASTPSITKKINFTNNDSQTVETSDVEEILNDLGIEDGNFNITINGGEMDSEKVEHLVENITDHVIENVNNYSLWLKPMMVLFGIAAALASTFGLILKIFLFNPLQIGGRRFFLKNLNEKADIKEYAWGFSNSYLNVVVTMFFRSLYTFLWSLLLVVPGIIKCYEYRMIPYLLAENSDMDRKEAFAISKEMMTGNKWDAFILDLSFIGWAFLNVITFGVVGLFFFHPYEYGTCAALYETLKQGRTETVAYDNYIEVE